MKKLTDLYTQSIKLISKILTLGDNFILKCLLVLLTAVFASVALDTDNKYMNLGDRILVFFKGIPEYDLEIIQNSRNNALTLKNKNNSNLYIHSINLYVTNYHSSQNTSNYTKNELGTILNYAVMFSPYLIHHHLVEMQEEIYYRPLEVYPVSDGIKTVKHKVSELKPRSLTTIGIEVTPLDIEEQLTIYYLYGYLDFEYYINDEFKTLRIQLDNPLVSYNGNYTLEELIDQDLIP